MKKRINSPKLFARYLFWLGVLLALEITIIWLVVSNTIWRNLGIFIAACLLLTAGVVLFFFNRQICLMWVENGAFHYRHILTGHHECFSPENVYSVSTTYDAKTLFFVINHTPEISHSAFSVDLEYSEENLAFVRSFWDGYIDDVVKKSLHEMKLRAEPFEKIRCRQKTIELRLFDEKRQQIKVGDRIVFTNTESGKELWVTVVKLHRFDSFAQLYQTLDLLQCGYTPEDVDKARPEDMETYYSAEEQAKYGVVGIEIVKD